MSKIIYLNLKKTFKRTFNLLKKVKENTNYKLISNFKIMKTSPLIWYFMNIIYYWNKYCISKFKYGIMNLDNYSYNDNRISLEKRFFLNYDSFSIIEKKYHSILNFMIDYLFDKELNDFDRMIINNSLCYNNIVNEKIVFTFFILNLKIKEIKFKKVNKKDTLFEINYINIPKGLLKQGNNNNYCFDNEYPSFDVEISSFIVSKYCITNGQYLEFVKHNGYNKSGYWDPEGWNYLKSKKLEYPLNWKKSEDNWLENIFGTYKDLRINNPVINISYYEAKAYCRWSNCRLIKESEWEYLANHFKDNILKDANLNGVVGTTVSVLNDRNINDFGVVGLFGNVWEWCEDPFYPYNGFKMDIIDRDRSFHHFGSKYICRGGSFATNDYILSKSHRGFEDPINLSKFIGFRVVKI